MEYESNYDTYMYLLFLQKILKSVFSSTIYNIKQFTKNLQAPR